MSSKLNKRSGPAARKPNFRHRAMALAVCGCFALPAHANPAGATVVNGSASISSSGHVLTITNSPGAIINWKSFSINTGELTRFVQQNAASEVLNRVTGGSPSQILGSLQSNGRVFIINPNGIVFGPGAQVDVAGLVASTLALSNGDFIAGTLQFDSKGRAGNISNQGTIRTASDGQVLIVAPVVENSGLIAAPNGQILLAAGKSVNLIDTANPEISVQLSAPPTQAVNLGRLLANNISIFGGIISNNGVIGANTAVVGQNGKIVLDATQDLTTGAASVITANGPSGGTVTLLGGSGSSLVQGSVSAQGSSGAGGNIQVLGQQVGVLAGASLNANGGAGGGTILVGGDSRGANPAVQDAQSTYIAPTAQLHADATVKGDGGKVVIWSNDSTRVYGQISTTGGAGGGNGGNVETSGNYLDISTTPNVSGPLGKGGTWLLDPFDVTIETSAQLPSGGTLDAQTPNFSPGANSSTILNTVINSALAGGNTVNINTGSSGTQNGNLTVNAPITSGTLAASLNLTAASNIAINQSISSGGGQLSLTLAPNSGGSGGTTTLGSSAVINNSGGTISFAKGITLAASSMIENGTLVSTDGSLLTSAAGNFSSPTLSSVTLGNAANPIFGITVSGNSSFFVSGNLTLANGGTLNVGSSTSLYFSSTSTQNVQTVTPNAGATINLSSGSGLGAFNQGNLVDLNAGIVVNGLSGNFISNGLNEGGSFINHGTINAKGGNFTINPNGFTNSSVMNASGGGFNISGGNFTNNGTVTGSNGAINISSTTFTNASGASLTLATPSVTNNITSSTFNNAGTVNINAGTLSMSLGGAGTWNETGVVNLNAGEFDFGGALNISQFTPALFTRASGTTVALVSGTLDLQGGTLDISANGLFGAGTNGGALNSISNATITNGTLISSDGTLLKSNSGSFSSPTLSSLTLGNAANPTFGISVNGNSSFFVSGNLTLANGGTLNVGSSTSLYFSSTSTQNVQTVTPNAGATINLSSGSGLGAFNQGNLVDLNAGIVVNGLSGNFISNGLNEGGSFINHGTINAKGGNFTINPNGFTNSSVMNASGGGFNISGGNFTNNGTVTGSNGAINISSTTFTNASGASLTLATPSVTNNITSSTFNNAGTVNINAGTLSMSLGGAGTWNETGVVNLNAGEFDFGGALNISQFTPALFTRASGTTVALVSGTLDLQGGTLDISANGLFGAGTHAGALNAVDNATVSNGTLISTDGTLLTVGTGRPTLNALTLGNAANPAFGTNTGNQFFVTGNLTLANGGTLSLGTSGALYFDSSSAQNVQTVTANAGATINLSSGSGLGLVNNGNTVDLNAGIVVNGLSNNSIVNSFNNGGNFINHGTINASGGNFTITANTFTNDVSMQASGGNFGVGGGTFINNAVVTGSNGAINISSTTFTNASGASLTLSTAGVTSNIVPSTFVNAGSLFVQAGTGEVAPANTFSNTGLIDVSPGARFFTNGNNFTNAGTGTLRGGGTYDLGVASATVCNPSCHQVNSLPTLTNNGVVDPGSGAGGVGIMTLKGNFIQGSTGELHIDLGGTANGQYDQLAITGVTTPSVLTATATLGGSLQVAENGKINGVASNFYADLGNSFPNLLSANGGTTGTISTFVGPSPDVTFVVALTGSPGITNTTASITRWSGPSGGDWSNNANWNRGVPTALKDAIVNLGGSPTVDVSTSVVTPHSLVLGDPLDLLAGGSLGLPAATTNGSGQSLLSNPIQLDGGTLTVPTSIASITGPLIINSGTLANTAAISVSNLTASGGSIAGTGGVTVPLTGVVDVSGGTFLVNEALTNNGSVSVAGGGTLNLGGALVSSGSVTVTSGSLGLMAGAANQVTGGTFALTDATIAAPLTVSGGSVTLSGPTTFASGANLTMNGGSLALTGSTTMNSGSTLSLNAGSFSDSGTYAIGSGAVFNMSLPGAIPFPLAFDNDGTFNINSGTVNLNGGGTDSGIFNVAAGASLIFGGTALTTTTLNSGAQISGAGSIQLAGGNFVNDASAALPLTVALGTTLNLNGQSISGTGTLTVNGTLDMSGSTISNALSNNSTGVIQASGTNTFSGAASNAGIIDILSGTTTFSSGLIQSAGTLQLGTSAVNTGILNGTVTLNGGVLNGNGTITGNLNVGTATIAPLFSPSVITVNGILTLSSGAQISGAGSIQLLAGSLVNNAGAGSPATIAAGTTLTLNGQTLSGSGALTVDGTLSMTGSSTSNAVSNGAGGLIQASGSNTFSGATSNSGTIDILSGTTIFSGGLTQAAGGSLNVAAGTTLNLSGTNGLSGTSTNFGTIDILSGTTTFNSGLTQNSGGSLSVAAGTTLNFSGTNSLGGAVSNSGQMCVLSGATTITAGLTQNGTGALNVIAGTTLNLGGTNNLGGASTDAGIIDILSGTTTFSSGLSQTAVGALSVASGSTLNLNGSNTLNGATANSGTLQTSGATTFNGTAANAGTFNILSGTTVFVLGLTQSGGFLKLGTSVTSTGNITGDVTLNGGMLEGSGVITGNLNIGSATTSPGFSPGTITVTGNLNLTSPSVTQIELAGTTQGTGYDYINVLGTANLAGTLNVSALGAYVPPAGSTYTFLSFAGSSGSFGTVNPPGVLGLNLSTLPTFMQLAAPGAPPASPPGTSSTGASDFPIQSFSALDITQSLDAGSSVPMTSQSPYAISVSAFGLDTQQPIFYQRAPQPSPSSCQP